MIQATVGGNSKLSPSRFHGGERLLAGAVPDLEETREGEAPTEPDNKPDVHDKHCRADVVGTEQVGLPFYFTIVPAFMQF